MTTAAKTGCPMSKTAGPLIVLCCLAWGLPARADGPTPPVGPDRLARHALGRADAAGKLAGCLKTRAADLKAVAEAMLAERDPKKARAFEGQLEGAHRALSACLAADDPAAGPLPPAAPGGVPTRIPRGRVRGQVIQIEPATQAAQAPRLQAWLEGGRAELLGCYLPAAARDPRLMGKAAYRLTFGPDGRPTGAELLSTSLANMSVALCAARKLAALPKAPRLAPGAKVTLRLTFTVRE